MERTDQMESSQNKWRNFGVTPPFLLQPVRMKIPVPFAQIFRFFFVVLLHHHVRFLI